MSTLNNFKNIIKPHKTKQLPNSSSLYHHHLQPPNRLHRGCATARRHLLRRNLRRRLGGGGGRGVVRGVVGGAVEGGLHGFAAKAWVESGEGGKWGESWIKMVSFTWEGREGKEGGWFEGRGLEAGKV